MMVEYLRHWHLMLCNSLFYSLPDSSPIPSARIDHYHDNHYSWTQERSEFQGNKLLPDSLYIFFLPQERKFPSSVSILDSRQVSGEEKFGFPSCNRIPVNQSKSLSGPIFLLHEPSNNLFIKLLMRYCISFVHLYMYDEGSCSIVIFSSWMPYELNLWRILVLLEFLLKQAFMVSSSSWAWWMVWNSRQTRRSASIPSVTKRSYWNRIFYGYQ